MRKKILFQITSLVMGAVLLAGCNTEPAPASSFPTQIVAPSENVSSMTASSEDIYNPDTWILEQIETSIPEGPYTTINAENFDEIKGRWIFSPGYVKGYENFDDSRYVFDFGSDYSAAFAEPPNFPYPVAYRDYDHTIGLIRTMWEAGGGSWQGSYQINASDIFMVEVFYSGSEGGSEESESILFTYTFKLEYAETSDILIITILSTSNVSVASEYWDEETFMGMPLNLPIPMRRMEVE
ncbi:hypothetical protein LJC61_03085 [Ruminococcaceae bacterium OttesenSCG-928-A16]|nr:hypothetical protein [Ruminococcaceae bacterium OttesenSCG-928-A16]